MRVALVSRELFGLTGGGIGQFVTAVAGVLAPIAEVTIFTTAGADRCYQRAYARRQATGGPLPAPDGVGVVFVAEPSLEEAQGWYHPMHCYSARVLEALRAVYGDRGPELVEFADYLGEGFVTLEAAATLDPFLADTRICVRVHTSTEIVELLNGFIKPDLSSRAVHDLERLCLARADRLIWQGGDVLGTYQRFYGAGALAPAARIRQPLLALPSTGEPARVTDPSERLRLLFAGRLERRKGVAALVCAAVGLRRDDFELTIVGGDTKTGSLATSMRGELERMAGGDPRVRVDGAVDRAGLAQLIEAHDVVVVPSLWECWPYAALEAMHLNRPVLATPVGGLIEQVDVGVSGWLAGGTDCASLGAALDEVLDCRGTGENMVRADGPAARARALCDEADIRDSYEAIARSPLGRARSSSSPVTPGGMPLVSAVVPYHRAAEFVEATVDSLLAQTYPRLEVILVLDGSFADEDWVVARIAGRQPVVVVSQMNRGLGAARNFGVSQSRGRYIFFLDADNVAEPEFVGRCVDVLEARPELAYVTSWSWYMGRDGGPFPAAVAGYHPLGSQSRLVHHENVAGDAAAVVRRRVFDQGFAYSEELTSLEDWHFYRELAARGRFGAVIPERLLGYRVREDSMQAQIVAPHRERLHGEIEARLRENAMRWTAPPS